MIFNRLDFNINDIVPVLITKSKGITLYGEIIKKSKGGLMHLIKIFLLIVFNLIIIVFMTQNSNEKVDIFFFNYSLSDAYLNVILLFNLLFGVAAGFIASVFIIISNKSQIKSLQNKNRILTDELNDLRNVAIDEGIYEAVDEEDY